MNLKKIPQIPQPIFDAFEKTNPQYLIIGIKKKNLPQPQYELFGNYCPDKSEMLTFLASDNISRFKTFTVGEIFSSEGTLRAEAKEYVEEKSKEQRFAKYQELKKEFENQLNILK